MNIDSLTLGELKQIAALLKVDTTPPVHPFVGRYVICRCENSGVHAGELVAQRGTEVQLRNERRLWSWEAVAGVALSGVAQNGLKAGKIDTLNPDFYVTDCLETIPCSEKAQRSIENA